MLFDLLALVVLVICVALGAYRGTLAGFLRVATMFAAYAAGILAATKFATLISLLAGTSRLMAGAMAGTGAFLAVYAVASVVSALLIRGERARRDGEPRSGFDRLGGALFGVGQATLALLLLGVLGSFLDAAYVAGLPHGSAMAADSYLVGGARKLVAAGVGASMNDGPGRSLAVQLASNPGAAVTSTQKLLAEPHVARLQEDTLFWEYVSSGDVERALARPTFSAIAYDEALRARLIELGVVDESARDDIDAFTAQLRATLTRIAPRLQAIRNDPALAELAAKPEIQKAIREGRSFSLLAHPDFRRLLDRALRDYENSAPAATN